MKKLNDNIFIHMAAEILFYLLICFMVMQDGFKNEWGQWDMPIGVFVVILFLLGAFMLQERKKDEFIDIIL